MQHNLTGADGLIGCFVGSATKELPLPKRVFSESLKWDFLFGITHTTKESIWTWCGAMGVTAHNTLSTVNPILCRSCWCVGASAYCPSGYPGVLRTSGPSNCISLAAMEPVSWGDSSSAVVLPPLCARGTLPPAAAITAGLCTSARNTNGTFHNSSKNYLKVKVAFT